VSDVLSGVGELTPVVTKAVSGIVGPKAAAALAGSVSAKRILSGREVLRDLPKHMDTLRGYEMHQLSAVNDGIFRHLEVEVLSGSAKEAATKNVEAYFDFLAKEKKEAAAHFATLYVQDTYPKAVAFMARECPILTMSMVLYVKNIRV
jgi:hypothetical protein